MLFSILSTVSLLTLALASPLDIPDLTGKLCLASCEGVSDDTFIVYNTFNAATGQCQPTSFKFGECFQGKNTGSNNNVEICKASTCSVYLGDSCAKDKAVVTGIPLPKVSVPGPLVGYLERQLYAGGKTSADCVRV